MNENNRNDSMGDTASSEASARAAKIKAIRNAIRNEEAPAQPEMQQRRTQPSMPSANGGMSSKAKKTGSKGKGKKKKKEEKNIRSDNKRLFPRKGRQRS